MHADEESGGMLDPRWIPAGSEAPAQSGHSQSRRSPQANENDSSSPAPALNQQFVMDAETLLMCVLLSRPAFVYKKFTEKFTEKLHKNYHRQLDS